MTTATHTSVMNQVRQQHGSFVVRKIGTLRGLAEVFANIDAGEGYECIPAAQYLGELNAAIKADDPRVVAEKIGLPR
jgi:hypothetical protein